MMYDITYHMIASKQINRSEPNDLIKLVAEVRVKRIKHLVCCLSFMLLSWWVSFFHTFCWLALS